jgi:hypothetical protein
MSEDKPKGRFEAQASRILDRNTYRRIVPQIDIEWRKSNLMYQQSGFKPYEEIPDAGKLLVQSPYTAQFDVSWGLTPIADQAKYRWLYRARTEVRRAIDIKTKLALGRGFHVVCPDNPKIEKYCNDLIARLKIKEIGPLLMNNKLVYGQCYAEKVRAGGKDNPLMATEQLENQPISVSANYDVDNGMRTLIAWSKAQFNSNTPREPYTAKLSQTLNEVSERYEAMVNEWNSIVAQKNRQYGFTEPRAPDMVSVNCSIKFEQNGEVRKSDISVPVQASCRPKFTFQAAAKKDRAGQVDGTPNGLVFKYTDRNNPEDFDITGELIALKVVDPLYMQVQRHPLDIIVGFIQWTVNAVPQTVMPEEMVYMRYMPNSWIYESAYGTSLLMPITHHVSMLIQAEEDVKTWHHIYAHPLRVLYVGEKGKPYLQGTAKIANYQNLIANLPPNGDLVLPGDTELQFPALNFQPNETSSGWINYLNSKVYEGIGVPGVLANRTGDVSSGLSNRSKSDDELSAFIAEMIMEQQSFGEDFMQQVLLPEIIRKFGKTLPEVQIIFPPILDEDWNKKADRVVKMVGQNAFLTPNEARRLMNQKVLVEGDKAYDKSLDEIPESAQAGANGFGAPSKSPEKSESQKTGKREESKQKRDRGNESAD